MNEGNLVPLNKRTKSEQREITRKGGIASGEARNYAKSIKQALASELSTDDGKANGYEKIGRAIIAKAQRGDVKAAAFVAKILGEDITRIEEVSEGTPNYFVIPDEWTDEQQEKWIPIITQCNKMQPILLLEDEANE